MAAPIKLNSFVGGELAPFLYGRTDLEKYAASTRTLRNFVSMRHGGATQRPGTMYVAASLNGGNTVRLIPFVFNETGNGQSYVLEFGNQYIAFYQNGAPVVSGGATYSIHSPYLQADLANLRYAESADVVTIVHPNYPIYELKRLGATNWTLTQPTFGAPVAGPTNLAMSGSAGALTISYFVSSVNGLGEESDNLNVSGVGKGSLAAPSTSNPITLTWTAQPGASSYRIYGYVNNNNQFSLGYLGTTSGSSFVDYGITPDVTQTFPVNPGLFQSAGNYPSTVGYVQQRRVFSATTNNPLGVWESQPGDFYNFNVSTPSKDSDAVIFSIAGDEVNAIQYPLELKFMLLMTTGAELYLQGNGTGVVVPSAINASIQSQYGCANLKPLKIGDVLLFNQALGSFIRDFSFDFAIDGYRGNDITIFASHLVEGYQLADWAYQKIPDSIVWAARSDGVLLGCTYVREQQILAWHRHDFTNGFVESVCSIPENGNYAVYLSIRRVINGQTVRYIERLSSRIWSDEISATYLDCFSTFNGTNVTGTTMTLTTPAGGFLADDSAYQQNITLQASGNFFDSSMVGQAIFLNDAAYASGIGSQGPDGTLAFLGATGNQVRCIIQAYISPTQVTITPNGAVPASLQNNAVTTWARAVNTVSGLGYLVGQQVSIWADRFVVGSPFNKQISAVYTVPSSGTLTLDKWYSVIYIGLPMVSDIQTLDLENSFGETLLSRRKLTSKIGLYVYKTRSVFAGSEDPDLNINNTANDPLFELFEFQRGSSQATYDEPPQLMTGQDYIMLDSQWTTTGRLFIRNVDPVPATILSLAVFGESPAQTPFYERA